MTAELSWTKGGGHGVRGKKMLFCVPKRIIIAEQPALVEGEICMPFKILPLYFPILWVIPYLLNYRMHANALKHPKRCDDLCWGQKDPRTCLM